MAPLWLEKHTQRTITNEQPQGLEKTYHTPDNGFHIVQHRLSLLKTVASRYVSTQPHPFDFPLAMLYMLETCARGSIKACIHHPLQPHCDDDLLDTTLQRSHSRRVLDA